MYLGSHMSIAGGLERAVERIVSVGGTALQIFTRNQRQWNAPEPDAAAVEAFARARRAWGPYPVAAHDSYLINLANPDDAAADRSVAAFAAELGRCRRLAIPRLVTHPGSHLGQGVAEGVRRYVARLDEALTRDEDRGGDGDAPTVLLETTAGQGTNLGSRFEELAAILEGSRHPNRLGICLDTCHLYAAGYDLRGPEAVEGTLARLRALVGPGRVGLVHLNDTRQPLGSRRDRHEHLGSGELGETAFRAVLAHPDLRDLPFILETPKDKALDWDRENLARLRAWSPVETGGDSGRKARP